MNLQSKPSRIVVLLLLALVVATGSWAIFRSGKKPRTAATPQPVRNSLSGTTASAPAAASSSHSSPPGASMANLSQGPQGQSVANANNPPLPSVSAPVHTAGSSSVPSASPSENIADVLEKSGDLSVPENRQHAVAQLRQIEETRKAAAWARAERQGIPKRIERPDGTVQELVAFEGDRPIYFTTQNANAAISTGANLLLSSPYLVSGTGITVGIWDGGSVRSTHQELTGRVTVKDGASPIDHATHVGGTIGAAGVVASAKGMAPAAQIDSYDWNSDKSEMTARGASYPGEPGTIYLSNHSYGYIAGWNYTGNASPKWDWWGNGTTSTSVEDDFGEYSTYARDSDSLEYSLPYYLVFRSAGNDRADTPATGDPVSLTPNGTNAVSYDPALYPAPDSGYKSGYDTMSFDAVAKNIVSVGSVSDAVSSGTRQVANANMSWFSSWGPTDDGRIKPDLVANGENLYSSLASSDTAYGSLAGTSMSSPNAAGSAALLVNFFGNLFPGHAMRASTLKGLLIQTADDRGNPGPDYQYGWGLMNVQTAADLIQAYRSNPGTKRLLEDRLTTTRTSASYSFTYSGTGAIRATLCWTDPAATAVTVGDTRTPELVNNLDLQLVGPTGTVYQPFVMPYVGDWTPAKLSAVATTGKNNTDNVEQVLISTPSAAGTYTAQITFSGTLTNGAQNFSLVISGGAANDTAPAPFLTGITPNSANGGAITLTGTGGHFLLGAEVKLTKTGQQDAAATGVEVLGDLIKARVNTTGLAAGPWNVVVINPDGQTATLANALSVVGALWSDNLETGATGWSHSAISGVDYWTLSTASSQSPTHAFSATAPASKNDNVLVTPGISIPGGASNLQFSFWHSYSFQAGQDGGVLEFSLDNGASWFDVTSGTSGAAFASGGYNSSFSTGGRPADRNPLSGRSCWSGDSGGFTQAIVNLTDGTKYAGKTLFARFRLTTNASQGSTGWTIDTVSVAGATPANMPPSITTPAAANPALVTGTSVSLSVTGTDDAGAANLTYTWTVNDDFTAPITFSDNGDLSARNTTATFAKSGTYTFTATVRDQEGLTATSSVDVQVDPTLSKIMVSPASATVGAGSSQAFTGTAYDQFVRVLSPQPTFSWNASGGGTIDSTGLFTAGAIPGGPYLVSASSGTVTGNASLTVTGQTLAAWQTAHFTTDEMTAGKSDPTVDFDQDGASNLMEYALGTDPKSWTAPLAGSVIPDGFGQNRLTLTFTRPKALPDVGYQVEVSGDLQNWSAVSTLEVTALSGTTEQVTARDPVQTSGANTRFIRLRTTKTTP